MAKKVTAKAAKAAASDSFKRLANGVQFDIFDLGKVLGIAEQAALIGADVDATMEVAIATWRKN